MNTCKNAMRGGALASKNLLAALAVLAVALVMLAAVPAVAADSETGDGSSTSAAAPSPGMVAAGYIGDADTADSLLQAIDGEDYDYKDTGRITTGVIFTLFYTDGQSNVTWTVKDGSTDLKTETPETNPSKGYHVFFTGFGAPSDEYGITSPYDASKTYTVELKIGNETVSETVKGSEVTFYDDAEFAAGFSVHTDLIIDINGQTLGSSFTDDQHYTTTQIFIKDKATLKVIDSAEKKGSMTFEEMDDEVTSVFKVLGGSSLVFDGITFSTDGIAVFPNGDASEVTILDSNVTGNGYAVATNASSQFEDYVISITIENSKLISTSEGGAAVMINVENAALEIKDSEIEAVKIGVFVRDGTANITGTTIETTGSDTNAVETWGEGTDATPGAVVVGNQNNGSYKGTAKLVMDGGEIIASGNALVTTTAYSANHSVDVLIGSNDAVRITCGNESASVKGLKYTASHADVQPAPLRVAKGSVALSGTIKGMEVVEGELTISKNTVIAKGATLTVAEGAALTGEGQLIVQGTLDNSTGSKVEIAVSVGENGSVTNDEAIPNIAYDADSMQTATISQGDEIKDASYGAAQRVEVKGDATVTGTLTIRGVLHVNEGVTLTIASTGKIVIEGAGTSIIEGAIVLEEGDDDESTFDDASLTIQDSAVFQVKGRLTVAGDLTVSGEASIRFMTGSSNEVGGKFSAENAIVESGASLTIAGSIAKVTDSANTMFEVAGTLIIESEDLVSEDFTVVLTADGAILEIISVKMEDGGKITVQDKGSVGYANGAETEPADYQKITITASAAGGIILQDGVKSDDEGAELSYAAIISGLKVVDSMKTNTDGTAHDYTMQVSGSVSVSWDEEYEGLGTAYGYASADIAVSAATVVVKEALTLGPGVTLSIDKCSTLDVQAMIDATLTGTYTMIVVPNTQTTGADDSAYYGYWTEARSTSGSSTLTKGCTINTENSLPYGIKNNGIIKLSASGSITTVGKTIGGTLSGSTFSGAYYETSVSASGTKTYHYVTVDAALAALNAGTTDDVTLYGAQTITEDATILSKDTITLYKDDDTKLTIDKNATLTIADGGKLKAEKEDSIIVKGTLHVDVYKNFSGYIKAVDSDVYSYDANDKGVQDNKSWAEWTNIKNALDNAKAGQTVAINQNKTGEVEIGEDITVKEGVTLDANAKTILVKQTFTLTIEGTLDLTKSGSVLSLAAATDASADVAAVAGGAVAYDSGVIKYTDDKQIDKNGASLPGAYYSVTESGKTVKYLASYTTGIANVLTADGQSVTLDSDGAVDSSDKKIGVVLGDVSVDGTSDKKATVTITDGNALTAGRITLSSAEVVVPAGVEVSATFADASGTLAVVAKTSANLTVADASVAGAAVLTVSGTVTDIDAAKAGDSSVAVSGTVYAVGNLTVSADKTAVSGELVVYGVPATTSSGTPTNVAASIDTLVVEGSVSVLNGSSLTGKTLTIDTGASVAVPNGSLSFDEATVLGSLDATADSSVSSAASSATVKTLYVGLTKSTTTAGDAAVTGSVSLNENKESFAVVAASGSVPEAWTDAYKATTYTVNDVLYVTVYANSENSVEIANAVDKPVVTDAYFVGWNADDKPVKGEKIGYFPTVTADIKTDIYTVTIKADGGVNYVTIDGVLLEKNANDGTFTTSTDLVAGKHTIFISAVSGYDISKVVLYSGTGAELGAFTDNSKEITLSGNPAEGKDTVSVSYSLIGSTAASSSGGSSSTGPTEIVVKTESDSGITDILLIVLVVLIVIMAALVAMRMMRS